MNYKEILQKLLETGLIQESDMTALVNSFDSAVTAKVDTVIEEQKEAEAKAAEEREALRSEIQADFDKLLEEEVAKIKAELETANVSVIDEAVAAKVAEESKAMEESNNEYKNELLDKVVAQLTAYTEESILPSINEIVVEEAHAKIIADSIEKDEAIEEMKSAISKVALLQGNIELTEEAKDEDDDDKEDKDEKSDDKSDKDEKKDKKDEDDKDEKDDDEKEEKEESVSTDEPIVEESIEDERIARIRARVRAKLTEESASNSKVQSRRRRIIEEQKAAEAIQLREEKKINAIIEEETDGLTSRQIRSVKRQLEGKDLGYVKEHVESIVDEIIEESIGYGKSRTRAYSNMVVDRAEYDQEIVQEEKKTNSFAKIAASEYL